MKWGYVVIPVLVIVLVLVLASVPSYSLDINGKTYSISHVAADESEWEAGLMNQTITNDTLMLFVFPMAGIYVFWMDNTKSPLDMIWMNVS